MELLFTLPVINEKENLEKMLPMLIDYLRDRGGIVFIDDNSTDGTDKLIKDAMKNYSFIHYIKNNKRVGLGNAYKMGAKYGIEKGYKWMQLMDSDLSHRIEDLQEFDNVKDSCDLIIGSRYVKGGRVENWPLSRRLLSKGGSFYARSILSCPIRDLTGGFNRIRFDVLKDIDFDNIKSTGYAFQIEMKYRAYKKGYRVKEVPIVFPDRVLGVTKMNKSIIKEAIKKVWWMKFNI